MTSSTLRWHDLECGGYDADLPLWHDLAAEAGGEVLDLGCGAGRVALALARAGHPVTGVDRDPDLVGALEERGLALPVTAVVGDARDVHLDRRFALCVMPMQTIQLMGGERGRAALLACAREHLQPGGLFAAAVANALEGFDEDSETLPLPDMGEQDGWLYSSQPIAVRDHGDRVAIERIRQAVAPDGSLDAEGDVIELDRLDAEMLEREGEAAGFAVEPARHVAATTEHVGSEVVVLRAP